MRFRVTLLLNTKMQVAFYTMGFVIAKQTFPKKISSHLCKAKILGGRCHYPFQVYFLIPKQHFQELVGELRGVQCLIEINSSSKSITILGFIQTLIGKIGHSPSGLSVPVKVADGTSSLNAIISHRALEQMFERKFPMYTCLGRRRFLEGFKFLYKS